MKRLTYSTAIFLLLGVFVWEGRTARALAVPADPHAYFKNLVARSDHWKSYTLRSAAQMLSLAKGGYAYCNSCPQDITYSPSTDTDPHAQDAAKVALAAFRSVARNDLSRAVNATENYLYLEALDSNESYVVREIKVDDEIMRIPFYVPGTKTVAYDKVNKSVYVIRGQHGTTATPHARGANVLLSQNSIRNQLHLPLATSDGHTYLFTWDAYYTDSWLNSGLINLKTFMFSAPSYPSGNDNVVWFEVDNRITTSRACTSSPLFRQDTDVSMAAARSANDVGGAADWKLTDGNHLGPGISMNNPVCPAAASFIVKPNRWVRYWVQVDQRADDYDYLDMWMADEETDATQIYSQIPISVRATGIHANSIHKFWLEFNTSTDAYTRGSERDFVTYVRNFVALRDVANAATLLQRPVAVPFVRPLSSPKHLRIVP